MISTKEKNLTRTMNGLIKSNQLLRVKNRGAYIDAKDLFNDKLRHNEEAIDRLLVAVDEFRTKSVNQELYIDHLEGLLEFFTRPVDNSQN